MVLNHVLSAVGHMPSAIRHTQESRANLRRSLASIALAFLAGCTTSLPKPPPRPALRPITAAEIVIPERRQLPGTIGMLQQHRVEPGETLLDIAREGGLGFQEVQNANPGVDEWVPQPGTDVVIPSRWVVPRSRYRGVVINVAEMRLYLFPSQTRPGQSVRIRTWPVAVGTGEAPSPVGPFVVRSKDENPTWIVPASIRASMDKPISVVPPGPDNPLGKHRIRLSKGLYQIHGTDIPWSIGRLTTHGCIRLYPEHIEELYALVEPGTPGEMIYAPVKFGEEGGQIYVQVHRDIYRRFRNLEAHALNEARKAGVADRIDRARLRAAVREQNGIPVDVTRPANTPPNALGVGIAGTVVLNPVTGAASPTRPIGGCNRRTSNRSSKNSRRVGAATCSISKRQGDEYGFWFLVSGF